MSDIDRLRAAADRLDGWVLAQITPLDRVYPATAALLRAVAEEFFHYNVSVSGIKDAALALADTILGVPNTGGSESGDVPYKNPADLSSGSANWQKGFVILRRSSNVTVPTVVPIVGRSFTVEGQVYSW